MQGKLFASLWGWALLFIGLSTAQAANQCAFKTVGDVMTLTSDCTTDTTIEIPNGQTLDGRNHTITAVDPSGGHFMGAVVKNAGPLANVQNLRITSAGLSDVCDSGDDALRGIFFTGVSGIIHGNRISNLNQGASSCPEGNAIEVLSASVDGTPYPPVQTVEITKNRVTGFQKTGIVCDGFVSCLVRSNVVGASATQGTLPANGIQIGFGAGAVVEKNEVAGNSWAGGGNIVATAILLQMAAPGTIVRHNNLRVGNADIGIYVIADGATVDNNRVYETGKDVNADRWDVGIYSISKSNGADTTTNTLANNKVRGYHFPYNDREFMTRAGGNNKASSSYIGAKQLARLNP